jgi:hypothetical protein
MKKTLVILAVSMMAQVCNAGDFDFCTQEIETLFDAQNPYNCVQTSDGCQSSELRAKGWMTSANGKCVKAEAPELCGMGGAVMVNPYAPKEQIQSLSTCDTDVLKQMGWVEAQ